MVSVTEYTGFASFIMQKSAIFICNMADLVECLRISNASAVVCNFRDKFLQAFSIEKEDIIAFVQFANKHTYFHFISDLANDTLEFSILLFFFFVRFYLQNSFRIDRRRG